MHGTFISEDRASFQQDKRSNNPPSPSEHPCCCRDITVTALLLFPATKEEVSIFLLQQVFQPLLGANTPWQREKSCSYKNTAQRSVQVSYVWRSFTPGTRQNTPHHTYVVGFHSGFAHFHIKNSSFYPLQQLFSTKITANFPKSRQIYGGSWAIDS